MRKRLYHRGYNVELADEATEEYSARVGGKRVLGSLLGVKQSIDWWRDTNIFREPNDFEKQDFEDAKAKKTEEYKGIQIMNDSEDDEKAWYMIIQGNLLKGSLPALKLFVDKNVTTKQ
ncbi:DUF3319 domain-containing protein [Enterovibrio nigricans]|uniref:Uncharacterized protein n=1 Tax=Enterovibrio nigricans DSM 22720 TaxID=1121868 RepID=A0A1T4VEM4_9GAMM|nr:DUF3319 domain-containing protein [Enterovibrio nigricans]PKF49366.1 DUF3319 domain-containing protein [Enterovibrio nigricans]SKA63424.1 Protein of unknown function [Enterovibrio nigricans DSM 22720]